MRNRCEKLSLSSLATKRMQSLPRLAALLRDEKWIQQIKLQKIHFYISRQSMTFQNQTLFKLFLHFLSQIFLCI